MLGSRSVPRIEAVALHRERGAVRTGIAEPPGMQATGFTPLDWAKAVIHLGPVQATLLAISAASTLTLSDWSARIQAGSVLLVTVVLPAAVGGYGLWLRQRAKLTALRQELENTNRVAEDKREAERQIALEKLEIEKDKARFERQRLLEEANKVSLQAKLDEVTRNFERMRENQHVTNNNLQLLQVQREGDRIQEEHLSKNLSEANEQIMEYRRALANADKEQAEMRTEMERLRRSIQAMPGHMSGEIKQAVKDAVSEAGEGKGG